MSSLRSLPLLSFAVLLACGDDPAVVPPIKDPEVVLSSITVTPASSMIERGASAPLRATGTYSDGMIKNLSDVTWSSSDAAIASVSSGGVVTAVASGTAQITATSAGKSGSAEVTVLSARVVSLAVSSPSSAVPPGDIFRLTATATLDDDTTLDVTSAVDWESSDIAVAMVSSGAVTAIAEGQAQILVRDPLTEIESPAVTVTVRITPPSEVLVSPSSESLPLGRVVQLSARAVFASGEVDVTGSVLWSSTAPEVAAVDAAGLVTSLSQGFASITAVHSSGVSGVASIRVNPAALDSIRVDPPVVALNVGERQEFAAFGRYSDGVERDVSGVMEWSSSDTAVATVSEEGRAVALALGTVTIAARDPVTGVSSGDSAASAMFSVVPPSLVQVLVVPDAASVAAGLTKPLQAFGVFDDGTGREITTEVQWVTSDPLVATVDAAGVATGVAVGTVTISATDPSSGISSGASSCALTVEPAVLVSLAVSPGSASMVVGSSQQFTATALFSDGGSADLSATVTWASSGAALSINAAGLATANALGTVSVSAFDAVSGVSSNDSNASAQVFIADAELVSISISPLANSVPAGGEAQFTALGLYNNNSTVDLTTIVAWSSSAPAVGVVSNAQGTRGLATAIAAGSTQISASDPFTGIAAPAVTLTVPANVTLSSITISAPASEIEPSDTLAFSASGTFSDGSTFPMTNAVSWSSTNPAVASISNTEGSRGVARGLVEGTVSISAVHVASGVTSNTLPLEVDQSIRIAEVLHYELEEGSGTVINSLSPGGIAGTLNGTATWLPIGPAPGTSAFALRMASGGTCNVNPNLGSPTYTNLTIEFWWRFGSGTGLAYMWNSNSTFRAFTNGVAGTSIWVRNTPGGVDVAYSVNVQNGSWHHIAYVLDATALQGRLYVNGALVGSTSYAGSILLSNLFVLGQGGSSGAEVTYDRYRIFSTALTAAEIQQAIAGQL